MDLVFRPGHVIKKELQDQGAAQSTAFDLKIRKAHGKIDAPDLFYSDESWIFHGSGKSVALPCAGSRTAVVRTVLPEIFPADGLVTAFPVPASIETAFVAQEFHLSLLAF